MVYLVFGSSHINRKYSYSMSTIISKNIALLFCIFTRKYAESILFFNVYLAIFLILHIQFLNALGSISLNSLQNSEIRV